MKTTGNGFSRHATAWVIVVLTAALLPRAEAAFDCSTAIFGLPTDRFKNWIDSMKTPEGGITSDKTSACANRTLEDYPELNFSAVAEGSDDALVRYVDSMIAFMELVDGDEFDQDIAAKVIMGRASVTADIKLFLSDSRHKKASLRDLVVPNAIDEKPFDDEDKISGSITLGDGEIANFARFYDLCQEGGDRAACASWEKSMRLILATSSLLNHYKPSIIKQELTWFKQALTSYRENWDDYFHERKTQLPWEMALNQFAHRDRRKNEFFSRPPKFDWILLHPSLVVSLNSDESGSDEELDLVLELIGINYWKSDTLSGVALVNFGDGNDFLNEDRFGVVFHFGSQYSLGWADSEDDGHWFVSIDLLARFDDERSKLKQREAEFKKEWDEAVNKLK